MKKVLLDGQEYTEYNLDCPECGAPLVLKKSKYGLFYGCQEYYFNGCKGTHGAHADGTPLGNPADLRTKQARILAHENFDRLWKSGKMSRKEAYSWLCKKMKIPRQNGHIGSFTIEQCYRLVSEVNKALEGHEYEYGGQDI